MVEKDIKLRNEYERKGYVNILSLTGGGCYGYGQALVLDACEAIDKFDVVGGTSIGGINALMVGTGKCGTIASFYEEHAKEIFSGSKWKRFKPFIPMYANKQIEKPLKSIFTNRKFKFVRVPTLISSYNINRGRPKYFWSEDALDSKEEIWRVARATSAAPTYFSTIGVGGLYNFADGGVFCNDPVMAICTQLYDKYKIPFKDMRVLGIGCGLNAKKFLDRPENPRFRIKWLSIILDDMIRGNVLMHRKFAESVLSKDNYVQIEFKQLNFGMDDSNLVNVIPQLWESGIRDGIQKINEF